MNLRKSRQARWYLFHFPDAFAKKVHNGSQKRNQCLYLPFTNKHDLIKVIQLLRLHFLGSMDNQWTDYAVHILSGVVGVVPICAELVLDGEVVQKARAGRNWTLSDTRGPIHPIRTILEHTMPVDG